MKELKSMAVVCNDFPTEGRATYVFVEQLVNALVDLGVEVKVIAPQSLVRIISCRDKRLPKHCRVSTKKGNNYEIFRPLGLSLGNHLGFLNPLLLSHNSRKIANVLNRFNVDAVYCHFWENVRKIQRYAIRKRLPVFVACGEGDDALENMMETISIGDKKELVQCVKGVISVSSENKRKCIDYQLSDQENITVQPNCADTTIFYNQEVAEMKREMGISEKDFTIVFVGGFIPRKGPDRIARAVTNLNDKHIKVMFIGKPFSGYDYEFDCPGIIHKGSADHDVIPKLLNCADVFVLPTEKEGCCNAIIEALACGLPVISSDGSFNDDILDEKNSIRIDPDDVDALARAIAYLRDNPDVCQQMREVSISRHEQYSIEGRARRIKEFIEERL